MKVIYFHTAIFLLYQVTWFLLAVLERTCYDVYTWLIIAVNVVSITCQKLQSSAVNNILYQPRLYLCVFLSVCLSVSAITEKRSNVLKQKFLGLLTMYIVALFCLKYTTRQGLMIMYIAKGENGKILVKFWLKWK